jgi:hypothetical protein
VASTGDACRGSDDGKQWRRDGSADGDDGMAWGRRKETGTQGTEPCWWVSNGEATGRAVAGGDRVHSRSRARERADRRGPPARERAIVRAGMADGRGRAASGRAWERGSWAAWAATEGESPGARESGEEKLGPKSAPPGGERNSIFFLFPNLFFFLLFYNLFFSFKQIFI